MHEVFKLVKFKSKAQMKTALSDIPFHFAAADTSCQDSDPYICSYWSKAQGNRFKCNFRFRQGYGVKSLRGKQFHEDLVTK